MFVHWLYLGICAELFAVYVEIRLRLGAGEAADVGRAEAEHLPLGFYRLVSSGSQGILSPHRDRDVRSIENFELADGVGGSLAEPCVAGDDSYAEQLDVRVVCEHHQRYAVVVQHDHIGIENDLLLGAGD